MIVAELIITYFSNHSIILSVLGTAIWVDKSYFPNGAIMILVVSKSLKCYIMVLYEQLFKFLVHSTA